MIRRLNLLPLASQFRFEHRRQARFWLLLWTATASALVAAHFGLLERRQLTRREVDAAQASIAPLLQLEGEIRRQLIAQEAHRRSLESWSAIEQADAPLALLQVVSTSCRELGSPNQPLSIELDSLRMDETAGPPGAAGKLRGPRKGLLIVGKAATDAQVTDLVGALRHSGAFSLVELEASQAHSEQHAARRTFQIRCLQ